MEKEVLYNENLHFEHRQWRSELAFWEDELKSFNNRLSELVTRWTKKEVLSKVEHFQNEFILHGGAIEDLKECIDIHEGQMASQSKSGKEVLNVVLCKNHVQVRSKMESQRLIYANLKKDFFRFLTTYM
ncbi:hypothetical protein [Flagellimonas meishanensis]|uniref:hypothetical protein n=1 Tax=Flagellimonas meishanensis TaxID=2873264 RepID=UPI001CA67217|nr:hypothetical protein [[Muricauda] meishanensis]